MQAKLYIFDLDGTLIEFHRDYLFSETHRILEQMEHEPINPLELEQSFSSFDFFRFFIKHRREELTESFWSHFDWENFPKAHLIDGALAAVKELHASGVKIAIATSRFDPQLKVSDGIEHTGLLDFISHIETRRTEEIHWSDKRGHLQAVCRKFGVQPKDAVMIGDIPPDITSAQEVGIGKTIAVLSGGINEEVLSQSNPSTILDSVADLRT